MAKRNLNKLITDGRDLLEERRSLNVDELREIAKTAQGYYDALVDMFYCGVALGYAQAKADAKRN